MINPEPLVATPASARFASVFPRVGVEVALALLKEPDRDWTVKNLALTIGRAASGVSERLRALREAGLVDRRNRPMRPELFWELVAPWHEQAFGLAEFPGMGGPFEDVAARSSRPGTRPRSESNVSGDPPVVLVAEVDSVPYRAVARLAELAPGLPPFAVIGGLAGPPQAAVGPRWGRETVGSEVIGRDRL